MTEKSAEDKVQECCKNIRQEIEHWKDINQNGATIRSGLVDVT